MEKSRATNARIQVNCIVDSPAFKLRFQGFAYSRDTRTLNDTVAYSDGFELASSKKIECKFVHILDNKEHECGVDVEHDFTFADSRFTL